MSSRTLRQWVLRTTGTKYGSSHCTLATSGRTCSTFTLLSASSLSLTNSHGAPQHQTRPFHHTPARRLFASSDAIAAGCLGVAGGILLALLLPRYLLSRRFRPIPPISWLLAADRKKCEEVASTVSTAFEMARNAPIRRRDQALREASFHVPHEVARINSGAAPHFRLEDMGDMPSFPRNWGANSSLKPKNPLDIGREGRAFLYFPHESARATAAIVAINAEIGPVRRSADDLRVVSKASDHQKYLIEIASNGWRLRHKTWADRQPHILDRIEPGRLPVIFCFRDKVSGCLYDPKIGNFVDLMRAFRFVSLNDPSQ